MKNNLSIWRATAEYPAFPTLEEDITVDVAIIGGGITGLTCAQLLSDKGISVAILEANRIGEGTTGNSTGNLYVTVDKNLSFILSKFDEKTSKAVVESRTAAVNLIETLIKRYDLKCDFQRNPWHLITEDDVTVPSIEKEYNAMKSSGLNPISETIVALPFLVKSSLKLEAQAQFNPLQYVKSLAKKIKGDYCAIYENTRVLDFESKRSCTLQTSKGKVKSNYIIIATHTPIGLHAIHTAIFPYRENAIAVKLKDDVYPPEGIFWALSNNNHYSFRTYSKGLDQYLIAIGEPYKAGQAINVNEKYTELERYVMEHFDVASIEYRWAAQSYHSADGLPYIGALRKKVFTATGFSTDGLTYGTLSAMIITDAIFGLKNKWSKMFDINRHDPLKSAGEIIKENINVLGQYVKNIPGVGEADTLEGIKPGEGRVMSIDSEKVGVYKSPDNKITKVSAVCTHMYCIVEWNNAEETWDCPCHGSRFTKEGDVIEGPAISNLKNKNTGQEI